MKENYKGYQMKFQDYMKIVIGFRQIKMVKLKELSKVMKNR